MLMLLNVPSSPRAMISPFVPFDLLGQFMGQKRMTVSLLSYSPQAQPLEDPIFYGTQQAGSMTRRMRIILILKSCQNNR
jgi:hypothetical protein